MNESKCPPSRQETSCGRISSRQPDKSKDEPQLTTLVLYTSVINTFDSRNSYSFTNVYKVPWSLIKDTIAEDVMKKDNGFVSVDASVLNMESK